MQNANDVSNCRLGVRHSVPGSCWGHPNTTACCKHGLEERCDVDACVKTCKSDFVCINDPCTSDIKAKYCPVETTCVPGEGGRPEMWAPTDQFRADLRGNFECLFDVCANHDCPCNCHCVPQSEKGYTCERLSLFVWLCCRHADSGQANQMKVIASFP